MSQVDIGITYADQQFPAGTGPVNHISVQVSGPTVSSQTISPGVTDAVFGNLLPGSYTATAQAFDGNGQPIGSTVSTSFTIVSAPNTVTLSIPSALTATVS